MQLKSESKSNLSKLKSNYNAQIAGLYYLRSSLDLNQASVECLYLNQRDKFNCGTFWSIQFLAIEPILNQLGNLVQYIIKHINCYSITHWN